MDTIESENLDKNINTCKETIEQKKQLVSELQESLLYINNSKEDIDNRIQVVNKFNTIITRDFRGYLLENIVVYIDEKLKQYAKEIFCNENTNVDFSLNGNNLTIKYDNKEYETLSGGEKQKIDLIVQFAIRDMLCKFMNFSSNILVIDEVFDNLDTLGCSKIIDFISNKLFDISSIFIISHHTDIDIPYDKEIIITKDCKGVSKLL